MSDKEIKTEKKQITSEQLLQTTKQQLDLMPKVKIRLPKSKDPKDPNFETVQINGYTYKIMRGVDVEVPDEVAQILYRAGY